jgi:hypothetical protein
LSNASPTEPMDGSTPFSCSVSPKWTEVYCDPASLPCVSRGRFLRF